MTDNIARVYGLHGRVARLDLSHNSIVNLPEKFGGMTSLIKLRMGHNQIHLFPGQLVCLLI